MAINKEKYNSSVFINCPFDGGYSEIFEAIIFTICDCGFIPRCAKERNDSSESRIEKIYEIISDCRHSIHDISYAGLDPKTKLSRFNMPYELGLFIGCKKFGKNHHSRKSCLILDKEKFRYHIFLSDIGGQDIREHNNEPKKVLAQVRNFLAERSNRKNIPGEKYIWDRYLDYKSIAPNMAKKLKLHVSDIQFKETIRLIYLWLNSNPIT
jgi:hypothetical protein